MSREALIAGGPNGAGKTTFARAYLEAHDRPFLSADAIAARIHPERPEEVAVQAARRFLRELDAHIARGDDFVVESTLSGRGPRRWLGQMRKAGYAITIVFLFVDTETSIRRVEERVRKGGHHVPNDAVRRRYHRSIRNFWREYRLLADRWRLIYNGSEAEQEVAYGEGRRFVVSDRTLFERFLQITEENTP